MAPKGLATLLLYKLKYGSERYRKILEGVCTHK